MATFNWTTPVAHGTDAEFRTWGKELSDQFALTSLVKTADTGQINWTTVTRPAVNVAAGYEIWRFNDALQGTAPIFLRIEFGTASTATVPQIWVTVGTGSNGAGTLTGTTSDRNTIAFNTAPTGVNWPSYLCVAPGFVGLLWKSGAAGSSTGQAFFTVSRFNDTAGVVTGDGYQIIWGANAAANVCLAQSVRTIATAIKYTASTLFSTVFMQAASSLVSAQPQAYPVFGINPRGFTFATLATVILAEAPAASTFAIAMVGATARTLFSVGSGFRCIVVGTGPGTIASYGLAFLWE